MNLSATTIIAGLVFGVFAYYFFRFARRESHLPSLFISIALMLYPLFIENDYLVWGIGVALVVLGYKLQNSA